MSNTTEGATQPVSDDLDMQISKAMEEDGNRFTAQYIESMAGMIVMGIILCMATGLVLPKLTIPLFTSLIKKTSWDVHRVTGRMEEHRTKILCASSTLLFGVLGVAMIMMYLNLSSTMAKVNGEMVNELMKETIKQIIRNSGTLDIGGFQWPIWIKNPTTADLQLDKMFGQAVFGGVPCVDIEMMNGISIPPSKYRRSDWDFQPIKAGLVAGALSSSVIGLVSGFIYIEMDMYFEGTWDAKTYQINAAFKLPFALDELPPIDQWPDGLDDDQTLKRSILAGMNSYEEHDETMLQIDSLEFSGGITTPIYILVVFIAVFLVLSSMCASLACMPYCCTSCNKEAPNHRGSDFVAPPPPSYVSKPAAANQGVAALPPSKSNPQLFGGGGGYTMQQPQQQQVQTTQSYGPGGGYGMQPAPLYGGGASAAFPQAYGVGGFAPPAGQWGAPPAGGQAYPTRMGRETE